MRLMTVLALSSVAALTAAGSARAENASSATSQQLAAAVYEGVDANGKRVRLTITDSGPEVLIQVDRRPALPGPHWTAMIGTGTAAAIQR
jgi:hypothetical protein